MATVARVSGAGTVLVTDQHINDRISGAGTVLVTDQHINDRISGAGAILVFEQVTPLFTSGSKTRFSARIIG